MHGSLLLSVKYPLSVPQCPNYCSFDSCQVKSHCLVVVLKEQVLGWSWTFALQACQTPRKALPGDPLNLRINWEEMKLSCDLFVDYFVFLMQRFILSEYNSSFMSFQFLCTCISSLTELIRITVITVKGSYGSRYFYLISDFRKNGFYVSTSSRMLLKVFDSLT